MVMTLEHQSCAYFLACAAHVEQYDRGGKPRFEHAKHVSEQMDTIEEAIVGYLHDVLEDSKITTKECIAATFTPEIAEAVDAITRREGEKYFDYIERCKQNPMARLVKVEDLKHNMDRSRWPDMPDSYYEREVKALAILQKDQNESTD